MYFQLSFLLTIFNFIGYMPFAVLYICAVKFDTSKIPGVTAALPGIIIKISNFFQALFYLGYIYQFTNLLERNKVKVGGEEVENTTPRSDRARLPTVGTGRNPIMVP